MAVDLIDFRLKVTPETACALAAYARANDLEKPEVARDILHTWALKQIHGASLLGRCLRAKGLSGAAGGNAGAVEGSSAQGGSELDWQDD